MKTAAACVALALALTGCGGGGAASTPAGGVIPTSAPSAPSYWAPTSNDTFQWDISDAPASPTSASASVYDVDMFGNDASVVSALHALGRHAVCYIDMGEWEPYRPDASQFPSSVIGNKDPQWNEYFLDIRRIDVLGPLMGARMDQCKQKGFDAVEPDQIETYAAGQSVTGFPLTYNDQLAYDRWIAAQAHARGLGVAMKNDADQVNDLVASFDWALLEDCFAQGWCAQMSPFVQAKKAVIDVEYTDLTTTTTFTGTDCPQAKTLGFYTILKHRNLDAWIMTCP